MVKPILQTTTHAVDNQSLAECLIHLNVILSNKEAVSFLGWNQKFQANLFLSEHRTSHSLCNFQAMRNQSVSWTGTRRFRLTLSNVSG